MDKKQSIKIDDTLKVGDKPLEHTKSKGQEYHDNIMKNKKKYLEKFKK